MTVVSPQGALWGDFQAASLTLQLPRGGRLHLLAPAWRGLDVVREAHAPWGWAVHIPTLEAASLDLTWHADPKAPPAQAPVSLASPVGLRVEALRVPVVRSNLLQGAPLTGVALSVAIQGPPGPGKSGGSQHRVDVQSLQWQSWAVSGSASVGVNAGLPVQAQWRARTRQGEGLSLIHI